jgi:perosamine synthetase
MTGIQAAMGIAQLGKLERFIEQKRRLAHRYNQALSGVPGLQLPPELEWARNVYWMYALTVDESEFGISRDQLMQELKTKGIETRTFFCPMNLQPFLQRQKGFRPVKCPVAERIWTEGLYLPSSVLLTDAEIEQVATAIRSCAHAPRAKRVANL